MDEYLTLIKLAVIAGSFLLALLLESLILPQILRIAYKKRLYDLPNARKVHKTPTPRLGGISFMPVIVIVLGLMAVARLRWVTDTVLSQNVTNQTMIYILFAMGLMLLYLIGAVDDLVGVSYRTKFVAQVIAAILPPVGGLWINNFGGLFGITAIPFWIGIPLTVFVFVYVINAINLIDGIDGLASGLSGLALILIAAACFAVKHFSMGILATTMVAILVVFFKYNVFNKGTHKLFMGDAGSMCLGYILALLIVHFWNVRPDFDPFKNNLNIVVTSALLIPLLDVVHVVLMRLKNHRNPFLPDKTHIHHRLMSAGLSARSTLFCLLALSTFIIGFNVLLATEINASLLVVIDLAIWLLMTFLIHRSYNGRQSQPI